SPVGEDHPHCDAGRCRQQVEVPGDTTAVVVGEDVRADVSGGVEIGGKLVDVFVVGGDVVARLVGVVGHPLGGYRGSAAAAQASTNLAQDAGSDSGSTRASASVVMKLLSACQRGRTWPCR